MHCPLLVKNIRVAGLRVYICFVDVLYIRRWPEQKKLRHRAGLRAECELGCGRWPPWFLMIGVQEIRGSGISLSRKTSSH